MFAAAVLSALAVLALSVVLRGRSRARAVHLVGIGLGILTTALVTYATTMPACHRTVGEQQRLDLAVMASFASAGAGVLAYAIVLVATTSGRDDWRFGLIGLALCTAVPVLVVLVQLQVGHWSGWMTCDP